MRTDHFSYFYRRSKAASFDATSNHGIFTKKGNVSVQLVVPAWMISVAVAALQAGVSAGISKVSIKFRPGPNSHTGSQLRPALAQCSDSATLLLF
jgi:hypothetical protein